MVYTYCCTVPLPPTNFSIIEVYHDDRETTVSLAWNPPQGSGPEVIVQNYSIVLSPAPQYQSAVIIVSSPPWNVTLLHNQEYIINITSLNCAGESTPPVVLNVEFGKQ